MSDEKKPVLSGTPPKEPKPPERKPRVDDNDSKNLIDNIPVGNADDGCGSVRMRTLGHSSKNR